MVVSNTNEQCVWGGGAGGSKGGSLRNWREHRCMREANAKQRGRSCQFEKEAVKPPDS